MATVCPGEFFDQCQLIRANAAAILKQRGFDVKSCCGQRQ